MQGSDSSKQVLARSRRAIVEVGKELGRKLLTGSFNLINLSMPVKMFESRSYLQKLADVWVYPRFLPPPPPPPVRPAGD